MPCKTINSGGKTYCGIGKNKTKHSWKPSCARTGDCSGKFRASGYGADTRTNCGGHYRFGEPAIFQYSCGGFCATVQPSPSGTDRCRGDDPEHSWEPSCARTGDRSGNSSTVCRTQRPTRLRSASHHSSFDLTGRDLTEYMMRSSPSAVLFHDHRRVWDCSSCHWDNLLHAFDYNRAQIDRVRETLLHCFRLRHSAPGTYCFFCTTGRCFFLSLRRVWCACVQPVTDIVPLFSSKNTCLYCRSWRVHEKSIGRSFLQVSWGSYHSERNKFTQSL